MLEVAFREKVETYMGPVFEARGFRYKYEGGGATWAKSIEDGSYQIGIGFFTDTRSKQKPEYRMTLFVDPDDIRDIRAYRHSGRPSKAVQQDLGIRLGLFDRLTTASYDAWMPFPAESKLTEETLERYAHDLLTDLEARIDKGKKWTQKTHRWEYSS